MAQIPCGIAKRQLTRLQDTLKSLEGKPNVCPCKINALKHAIKETEKASRSCSK